ncbi:hypothetical protein [Eggerthella sinensis]|uniref:Uncharacterized protein n=1 Tax=Eggerthella sinensis TaxID=242230 RepID=A0A3N0IWG0_9ACTN|nr:hypothetical protein [Eggerthella sinensis]RDB69931.1 hypothetical protein C1876_05970 [Eggerthella sinensis]RNM40672.1 hypothetical protein DMP09_13295 [Eggerthella sinensis]
MDLPEQRLVVHPRIQKRHPDVLEEDVRTAWRNAVRIQKREGSFDDRYLAVGIDQRGRLLEITAVRLDRETVLAFHAMKATVKAVTELGLKTKRRRS